MKENRDFFFWVPCREDCDGRATCVEGNEIEGLDIINGLMLGKSWTGRHVGNKTPQVPTVRQIISRQTKPANQTGGLE